MGYIIKEAESTFKKLILIKQKLLIINKFIKQWFSYINKLISVYQILITFNFMSMFTWVMKYNFFFFLAIIINKMERMK
jgi:hypothetical protein